MTRIVSKLTNYTIRQCSNQECRLRFPAPDNSGIGINCPKCKSITVVIHNLRINQEFDQSSLEHLNIPTLEVVLDNVRSTFNVGAIFRTADGAGVKKIHLCGITPSPTNLKVHKTALGAENSMPYELHKNTLDTLTTLKEAGRRIWALEETESALNVQNISLSQSSPATVLVVGNEIVGVDPDVLAICDLHLRIPMAGIKGSLNVAVAFGIAVYNLLKFQDSSSLE